MAKGNKEERGEKNKRKPIEKKKEMMKERG